MNNQSQSSQDDFLDQQFDAIIVGSGMGGLNCACKLALNDKKVLVLEKNGFIGGRCSSYKKKGYTIDYGIHAFALGMDGPLHTLIEEGQKYFKKPLIKWARVNPVLKYKKSFIRSYMPINLSHFWNIFKTGINFLKIDATLSEKMEFLKLAMEIRNLKQGEIDALGEKSVKDFLSERTDSTLVHALTAICSDSYAVVPYDYVSSQDFIPLFQNVLSGRGTGYPFGGCGAIPEAYKKIIELKGGRVVTSHPVEKVILDTNNDSKKVIGVKLAKSNREILSDCIISNVNLKDFLGHLIDKSVFSEEFQQKVQKLMHSLSSVVIHAALDEPLIKDKFVMKSATLKPDEIHKRAANGEFVKEIGCFMPIVSNIDKTLAPEGCQLALGGIGTTKEVYEQHKENYKELILDDLQELAGDKVNLRDHIEFFDIIGPQDLSNLFGEQGAVIGLAQMVGQVREDRFKSKLSVSGLYHCGDDSGIGLFGVGTELAALSGQNCADLILKDKII